MPVITDLEIINLALVKSGNQQVGSPTDNEDAWTVFSAVKPAFLEQFPFKDHLKMQLLSRVASQEGLESWYSFKLPDDFLGFDSILNTDDLQPAPGRYQVMGDVILTKEPKCFLRYSPLYPQIRSPLIRDVLATRIGRDLSVLDEVRYRNLNRTYIEMEKVLERNDGLKGDNTFDDPQLPIQEQNASRPPPRTRYPGQPGTVFRHFPDTVFPSDTATGRGG